MINFTQNGRAMSCDWMWQPYGGEHFRRWANEISDLGINLLVAYDGGVGKPFGKAENDYGPPFVDYYDLVPNYAFEQEQINRALHCHKLGIQLVTNEIGFVDQGVFDKHKVNQDRLNQHFEHRLKLYKDVGIKPLVNIVGEVNEGGDSAINRCRYFAEVCHSLNFYCNVHLTGGFHDWDKLDFCDFYMIQERGNWPAERIKELKATGKPWMWVEDESDETDEERITRSNRCKANNGIYALSNQQPVREGDGRGMSDFLKNWLKNQ